MIKASSSEARGGYNQHHIHRNIVLQYSMPFLFHVLVFFLSFDIFVVLSSVFKRHVVLAFVAFTLA